MDFSALQTFIDEQWVTDVLPVLSDYIAIPVQSPAFDAEWESNGHMDRAVDLLTYWARRTLANVEGAKVEVWKAPGQTPAICIDIPGEGDPVLIYGHLDKQPPLDGWADGRSAWSPSLEGDRLYGRGGADDGYALFCALTAVTAVRAQGHAHARCVILLEACEESGSQDLAVHLETLLPRLGTPSLIVALDAGAIDYEHLWVTTSVRGQVAGTLSISVLKEAIHSGDGAGVVASPLRIARALLSRIEDERTGRIHPDFQTQVPDLRREQAASTGPLAQASLFDALPLVTGAGLSSDDGATLLLNRAWSPQLTVTGLDGLPGVAGAAAVVWPEVRLKLGLRLPPTLDAQAAAADLKRHLEAGPDLGGVVRFDVDMISQGWHAPEVQAALASRLESISQQVFNRPVGWFGGGGGIPFLADLSRLFPRTPFLVTGVLGPESNAHGPNEFLHLPTARRLCAVLAGLIAHGKA